MDFDSAAGQKRDAILQEVTRLEAETQFVAEFCRRLEGWDDINAPRAATAQALARIAFMRSTDKRDRTDPADLIAIHPRVFVGGAVCSLEEILPLLTDPSLSEDVRGIVVLCASYLVAELEARGRERAVT